MVLSAGNRRNLTAPLTLYSFTRDYYLYCCRCRQRTQRDSAADDKSFDSVAVGRRRSATTSEVRRRVKTTSTRMLQHRRADSNKEKLRYSVGQTYCIAAILWILWGSNDLRL